VGAPTTLSDRQGVDFSKYHQEQHGGSAPLSEAFVTLDSNLRGSAMMNGIDQAIAASALLHDETLATKEVPVADQSGGKRHKKMHKKSRKQRSQKQRSQKQRAQKQRAQKQRSQKRRQSQRKRSQQGGGMPALGYDTVSAPGLLLDNKEAYSRAGLNPDYYKGTSTEQLAADMRDRS